MLDNVPQWSTEYPSSEGIYFADDPDCLGLRTLWLGDDGLLWLLGYGIKGKPPATSLPSRDALSQWLFYGPVPEPPLPVIICPCCQQPVPDSAPLSLADPTRSS